MLDVAGRTESYARLVGGRELKMADKADAMAYQIIEVSEKVTPALRDLRSAHPRKLRRNIA